ncbi:MAG TPA: hypothetical protein VF590_02480, partial [Isosphaeraceae bacterium]
RAVSGNDVRQGPSVVARTGVDGAARVVLRPPTAGEAREQERDSLETALLRTLDPAAATPRDALAGLRELARQYRREGGGALRRALDDTLRGLGQTPGAADPTGDPLRAWSYRDVTVVALAHDDAEPDPGATVVQAAAALTLALKDWIGPWLATFREVSEAGSRLGDDLRNALRRGGEPGELLGRVHDRVREFVEDQPGLVGQQVGRAVAERSLRDFLDRGLEGLSREANVALFPALEVASRAIAAADPSVLGAVGQVRADLRRDVDAQVGRVRTEVLGTLTPRLDGLQSRLDAKADAQALDGLRGELDALRLTTTRLDQAARDLNTNVSSLQTTFVRIDRDVQVLKGVRDVP